MEYTINEYMPRLMEPIARVEAYRDNETAAKLLSAYRERDAHIVTIADLMADENPLAVPSLRQIGQAMYACLESHGDKITVFCGIDAWLLLRENMRQDFCYGLRNFVDKNFHVRFQLSVSSALENAFQYPRYEDSTCYVRFRAESPTPQSPSVCFLPVKWAGKDDFRDIPSLLKAMGDMIPDGHLTDEYRIAVPENWFPPEGSASVSILRSAAQIVKRAFPVSDDFPETLCDALLTKASETGKEPVAFLEERFQLEHISPENAPKRLDDLRDDELWPLYAALVKSKINMESYLYRVLDETKDANHFLANYANITAAKALRDHHAEAFAQERAAALRQIPLAEPLIAQFVEATSSNQASVPFLNGGTSRELSGLIQRAAQIDLFTGLPEAYRKAAPVLDDYLSPFFDYGSSLLTDYFYTLRMFRIKNTVTKAFTERAYQAVVPDKIPQRDVILSEWNDGNTGLFVVDGMGAEYYPLLIKLSERSGFTVEARRIASAKLPTSTDFNSIKWNPSCVIPNAKKADDISHVGHSAHEMCDYAENLSETLRFFQITVMERITKALQKFSRVVVTADHGSSWLTVIAHKEKLSRTISWDNPDDWRYAKVPANMEATDDFESVYRPDLEEHYFVVRGYNRLAKQGGKPYGLHGGASLEERLIPFVVLSRAQNKETEKPEESQMEENDDFLTLL